MAAIAIVPAAGRAERFGGGKLIAPVDGEPLLNHTLRSLLDGGVERIVLVTAPDADFSTVPLLADARVTVAINPDPSRGMFSSIQTGAAAAEGDPILVLPADMPFVSSETIAAVLTAARDTHQIASPRVEGKNGHPVALPGGMRGEILHAPNGTTLSTLIAALGGARTFVDVGDPGVRRDVDTRADLA